MYLFLKLLILPSPTCGLFIESPSIIIYLFIKNSIFGQHSHHVLNAYLIL